MPAPEDLTPKTPGEPLGTITPITSAVTGAAGGNPSGGEGSTTLAQAPLYVAKHIAGGRWHVVDAQGERIGDFVGDKVSVLIELDRLLAGGEPLKLDPERNNDRATQAQAGPSVTDVDASTLKQPVLTPDGWLCPEPPVKE